MNESKTIKDWNADERPREKMLQKGVAALSDAELLAILIVSGTKNRTALDLARDMLDMAGKSLHDLGKLSVDELKKINGIGEARAITICAALEIGRRRQANDGPDRQIVNTSRRAAGIIVPLLRDLNFEVFYVLYLNSTCRLLREERISSGGATGTVADVRMILKNCLLYNANRIIVAHNHPSGSKQPSDADKILTAKLKEAAAMMDIKLVDHLIVAGGEYLSMADEGLM